MNIQLTGHHLEITPAIRDYTTSKLSKIKRHFDGVMDVTVILSVDKLVQKAEATVHISGKTFLSSLKTKICMRRLMLWWINWIVR